MKYQKQIEAYLKSIDAPVIVDVGAYTGALTRLLRVANHRSTVHAFEPCPKAFAILQSRADDLTHCYEMAVGYRNEEISFYVGSSSGRKGKSISNSMYKEHVMRKKSIKDKREITVKQVRLDDVCEKFKIKDIDFMKVNAEGAEYMMFLGQKFLSRVRCIQIQWHCNKPFVSAWWNKLRDDNYRFFERCGLKLLKGSLSTSGKGKVTQLWMRKA